MITPELPPVTVTLDTITGEPEAIRMPALPIVRGPPAGPRWAVTGVVVPLPPWTRRVPDQTRAFAAIVYVTVDAPPSNVTSTNSALPDGRAEFVDVTFDGGASTVTYTMAANALVWSGTLRVQGGSGTTTPVTAHLGPAGGPLTIGNAGILMASGSPVIVSNVTVTGGSS